MKIGLIPDGYEFAWNEGHERAIFHAFQTADESGQLRSPGRRQPD
jgi:hypothetical protein